MKNKETNNNSAVRDHFYAISYLSQKTIEKENCFVNQIIHP